MKISPKRFRNLYYSLKRSFNKDILINKEARGDLKFGICIFNRFTIFDKTIQVMGDELQARAIAREIIAHCPQIRQCQIYDIKEAGSIDADVVFVMWPNYPMPKKRPKKHALWLQNAGFEDRLDEFLKKYDHVFSPSKKCCGKFKELIYLPMACEDSSLFKKTVPDKLLESDICFVGNYDACQRPASLQRDFMLPAARYNFKLWGTNWDRSDIEGIRKASKGRLEPKDIPAAYSSSKIVLSNHCLVHRNEEIVTTRIYEALACEAFVISDWFNALEEFKYHVIFTSGGKDLEEKLEYFLSHPVEREKKVSGAREFILKNHTFRNRVEAIAKKIGLEFV